VATSAIGYGIVALFLVVCGYYVQSHWHEFVFLREVSYPEALAAGLLVLLSYLVSAYQMNLFLEKFGLTLGPMELIALTNGMILGNLVIPMRGGSGGLAVYLKKVHDLDFQAFAAIYGGTALLTALINTALAVIALVILQLVHGFHHGPLSVLVVGVFAFCLYLSLYPPPVRWRGKGVVGLVFRAAHSWRSLSRDRILLIRVSASLLVISLALCASFYCIYRALGEPLSISAVIVTSSLGNVANLVPITPGSLGIFDAVTIQIPQFLGLDPARSIAGTLVFRALTFFWACLLGIPGMIYMVGRHTARR